MDLPALGRAAYAAQAAGRREDYFWLRDTEHLTIEQAATRIGVTYRTAIRYKATRRPKRPRRAAWTPEETATALRTDLTARQVAAITGRTFEAVRRRRQYVRTRGNRHG